MIVRHQRIRLPHRPWPNVNGSEIPTRPATIFRIIHLLVVYIYCLKHVGHIRRVVYRWEKPLFNFSVKRFAVLHLTSGIQTLEVVNGLTSVSTLSSRFLVVTVLSVDLGHFIINLRQSLLALVLIKYLHRTGLNAISTLRYRLFWAVEIFCHELRRHVGFILGIFSC